jgi:plastocyanin
MFASRAKWVSRAAVALAATSLTLLATGCTEPAVPVPSDDDATDIGAVVQVLDNRYDPIEVEINVGQAVRWEFVARDKHDVVSNDRSFVSELVYGGTTYTHIFDEAGDYSYLCSIHPEMVGLVTVTE